jgi:Kef-type K+ transport system membrane component KefB
MASTFTTAALFAAFLAPTCALFGAAAKKIKLPSITGYLLAGVTAGPHVLGLISEGSVQRLNVIDQVCLGVIALAAGAELRWETIARVKKQVP